MIENLNKDEYPILFEGLQTTFPIHSKQLRNKKIYIRAHNIEHEFYKGLEKSELNVFKKKFFNQEAKKLKRYEKVLKNVNGVFTIAPHEQDYFLKKYGTHCVYIPAFHNHNIETKLTESEPFLLYHGNLSVSENVKTALFLIDTYKNSGFKLKIASSYINKTVLEKIDSYNDIQFIKIDQPSTLLHLFEKAQINVLPTFQKTGIKLKLLNTLYQGRFIIANDCMIEDTGLEELCALANTSSEFLNKTKELMGKKFTINDRKKRLEKLAIMHPLDGAQKIIDIIFK